MTRAFFTILLCAAVAKCAVAAEPRSAASPAHVTRTNYHGWADSILLVNGKVEVVIVPQIGRVMQFRFAGEADGPFWENRSLDGHAPDPAASEWGNFGGDKTWPSPQADWGGVTGRAWPPPPAFDSLPVTARILGDAVELESPVDAAYGIRTRRLIRLVPGRAEMTIQTTFEKVAGAPSKVGVWVITQLKHPVQVFSPIPPGTMPPLGYNKQSDTLPLDLKVSAALLSLRRDPTHSTKIGTAAGTLLWIGEKEIVRIDSPREGTSTKSVGAAEYPDQGSSAEVYTNPNPNTYVELELLGPLRQLKPGESLVRSSTYTLFRRTRADAGAEARALLKR